jgi:hypothetical protein
MTASDLVDRLNGGVSELQLAYLVHVRAVSPPLRVVTKPEGPEHIFDEGHWRELRCLLAEPTRTPAELRERSVGSLLQLDHVETGYTERARAGLKPRERQSDPVLDRQIKAVAVEDIDGAKLEWTSRLWRYLTTFRLYNVRLTGDEQVQLAALTAVVGVLAPVWLVVFAGPRVRHFGDSPAERCLLEYVFAFEKTGWGQFQQELDLASSLAKLDPDLSLVAVSDGLAKIAWIEAEYARLRTAVFNYVKVADPEGLLLRRVVHDQLRDRVAEILGGADRRGREVLNAIVPDQSAIRDLVRASVEGVKKAAV